jgi:hypothetical protein
MSRLPKPSFLSLPGVEIFLRRRANSVRSFSKGIAPLTTSTCKTRTTVIIRAFSRRFDQLDNGTHHII